MITYGQLPERPKPGVMLACLECGSTYSATRGDYFQQESDAVPTCGECGCQLELMQKQTTFRRVAARWAER